MSAKDALLRRMSEKSPYFYCPKCNYVEARLVKGDVAMSPCPNCGASPLYRVK